MAQKWDCDIELFEKIERCGAIVSESCEAGREISKFQNKSNRRLFL
jgi:hypothetical protein